VLEFLVRNETFIIIWLGAISTFAIYSILYKENPYYRLFEHIFIGLAAGQGIYISWTEILRTKWWDKLGAGQWWWIFALVIGLMWYFIYSQRNAWISRLIMGVYMGFGAGMIFQYFASLYIPWISQSFKPVYGVHWYVLLNNAIFIAVLLTVMAYFFFSIDHKAPAMRKTASTGRWLLMFAFGAMFGSTVMARMSLFIGRMNFLINDWAPKVPDAFWWSLAAVAVIGAFFLVQNARHQKKHQTDEV
jgi:hypothetical protein